MKLIWMLGFIIHIYYAVVFKRYELFGNATEGCYTLPIYLGGQAEYLQKQSMLIDTGSAQTILTCSDCTICEKRQLPFYSINQSSSSHIVTCGQKLQICKDTCNKDKQHCYFYSHYLDGSSAYGKMVEDKIRFSSQETDDEAYNINFVCNQVESYSSIFKPNGIIGIAPYNSNILDWWFYRNQMQAVITVCLAKNGGYLQLGINQQINDPDIILQFDNSSQQYDIKGLKSIQYSGKKIISLMDQSIIIQIDTGSSTSVLPYQALQAITKYLKDICKTTSNCIYLKDSNCVKSHKYKSQLTLQSLDDIFPSIDFILNGNDFKMMPRQYFKYSTDPILVNAFCLTIMSIYSYDNIILGIDFMADNRFQFNLDKSTVSIKYRQNCIYQPLKQSNSFDEGNLENYYIYIIAATFLIITILLTAKPKIYKIFSFFRSSKKSHVKRQLQQESTVDQPNEQESKQGETNDKNITVEQHNQNVANVMINSEIDSVLKVQTV